MADRALAPDLEPLGLRGAMVQRANLVAWHGDPEASDNHLPGIERYLTCGEDAHETYRRIRWPSLEAMVVDWIAGWREGRVV